MLKPSYILTRDTALNAVVLAVRGTHSFKDAFTSLTGASKPHHVVDSNNVVLGYSHVSVVAASIVARGAALQCRSVCALNPTIKLLHGVCKSTTRLSVFIRGSSSMQFGMLAAARWLKEQLTGELEAALAANPGYKLYIVGHSLGGGTAAMLTMMLREGGGAFAGGWAGMTGAHMSIRIVGLRWLDNAGNRFFTD